MTSPPSRVYSVDQDAVIKIEVSFGCGDIKVWLFDGGRQDTVYQYIIVSLTRFSCYILFSTLFLLDVPKEWRLMEHECWCLIFWSIILASIVLSVCIGFGDCKYTSSSNDKCNLILSSTFKYRTSSLNSASNT